MGDSENTTDSDAEAPDGGLPAWLRRLWRRIAGPPPQLLLSDIVSPDAQPICPECTEPNHRLAYWCPSCGERVGVYRTLLYPDLVLIWGRGLWRLMRQRSVSRLVWAGMVMCALGWLWDPFAMVVLFQAQELEDAYYWGASMEFAVSLVVALAGAQMMAKAWRLRGTWGGAAQSGVVTAGEGAETGAEEK